jgi:hypothetical protein
MSHGRSRQLIRVIVLLVAVVAVSIVASAVLRYNRSAGWYDAAPASSDARDLSR